MPQFSSAELTFAAILLASGVYWVVILKFGIQNRFSPPMVKVPISPMIMALILAGFGIILLPLINPFGEPVLFTATFAFAAIANGLLHLLLRKKS